METFETKLDDNPLDIIIKPSSDALLDGSNKVLVTIYNKEEPRKWRKVNVEKAGSNKFHAEILKTRLERKPTIKIRTNFIVDNIDLKEQIVKTTTIRYNLTDTLNSKDYESKYQNNDKEYDMGRADDETFSVSKRIEVLFT
ncbi:hypothetical protein Q4Q34_06640 [Flavivirga abyssicola]|uniref:hypothetical protein n=1 Tax=Flavivirga abyssicola TaxID=3063533 RepID=UPI0026DFC89B|nr:hypothetical protein [Flavivirga sp. MEBiC07777]WVK14705.1 hypothetical protein Q4Q34_06640 [Flavivirga sp. MEBiC07777]